MTRLRAHYVEEAKMKIRTNVRAGYYYGRCGGNRCGGSTRCGGTNDGYQIP
jgi:hypothetical protein